MIKNIKHSKGFSRIDKVLKKTAKNYKLEDALVKHRAMKHWQQVASTFIAEDNSQTKAIDFKKGVLTIACLNREVAQKIKLLAIRIIESLNDLLGRRAVFAIQIAL